MFRNYTRNGHTPDEQVGKLWYLDSAAAFSRSDGNDLGSDGVKAINAAT
jgi:hypothetical protein